MCNGISKREEIENKDEEIFKETMAKNFPNLLIDMKQMQEAQRIPSSMNIKQKCPHLDSNC